jgi:uncharacterized protein
MASRSKQLQTNAIAAARLAEPSAPIIDVDLHIAPPSMDQLAPYFDPVWLQFARERNWRGPSTAALLDPPDLTPSEWGHPISAPQDTGLAILREHILDYLDVETAILTCYTGIDALRHPDLAAAYVRAVNDWMIHEWVDHDSRLRASMIVPARDPSAMVMEIDRVGDHSGIVQVLLPVRSDKLYGNRAWHPVYEAVQRHHLVVGLHRGGTTEGAPSPTGWPSWYVEEYVAEQQVFAAQITSLVSEGVFQVFADLRVAFLEMGFSWLPAWWWRLDGDWKGLRREVPWVTARPSEILRERVRVSTAPSDLGEPEEIPLLLKWLGSEDVLMFATDYPHAHGDDIAALLEAMSPPARRKVLADNAREWYRL